MCCCVWYSDRIQFLLFKVFESLALLLYIVLNVLYGICFTKVKDQYSRRDQW